MKYPFDFPKIRFDNPIDKVMERLDLKLKQLNPNQWKGTDPICGRGGLTLTKGLNKFYCHGCKAHGDVIELVRHIQGFKDVKDAAAWLAGPTVPEEQGAKATERSATPSVNLEEILKQLDADHEECGKLELTPHTLHHFGAGYKKAGMGRGNVLVQLHDIRGTLRGYISLGEPWLPKDIVPTEYLFNAHRLSQGEARLVSSPLEVLRLFEFTGEANAVAFLTPSATSLQLRFLAKVLDERSCTLAL